MSLRDAQGSRHPATDAAACEVTTRRTPPRAATGRSQASAPLSPDSHQQPSPASERAGCAAPRGCSPAQPARPAGGPVARTLRTVRRTSLTTPWQDHEQTFRAPSAAATGWTPRRYRRAMYDLADGVRELSRPRVACCRRKRIAGNVALLAYHDHGGTHAHYHGLALCGSVWECPICRLQVCAHRASEVQQLVATHRSVHGKDTVYLLTVTTRHGLGDDLATARRGVSEAWTKTIQGRWWVKLNQALGFELTRRWCGKWCTSHKIGVVRALETTHGQHGWHVHLHLLLLVRRPLSTAELSRLHAELDARWRKRVVSLLGREHAPDREHGVDLRPLRCCADYVSKLGLEMTDPGTKVAKNGNRTPLQIAHAYATTKRPEDAALWQAYCEGMRGARMLSWSHGLREFYRLGNELTDEEIVTKAENQGDTLVGLIPATVWDALREVRRGPLLVLEAAERGGASEARRVLAKVLSGHRCELLVGPPDA
jgi:hypothetical protein